MDSLLQSTACYLSKVRDDRRRPVESTPAVTITFSEQAAMRFHHDRVMCRSACSGQRGLHEVYTTSHDASVKRLASYDILLVYASDWHFIIETIHVKSAFSEKVWHIAQLLRSEKWLLFPV